MSHDLRGDDLLRATFPGRSLPRTEAACGVRGLQDAEVVECIPARRCEPESPRALHGTGVHGNFLVMTASSLDLRFVFFFTSKREGKKKTQRANVFPVLLV